jgi:hypothetical protein
LKPIKVKLFSNQTRINSSLASALSINVAITASSAQFSEFSSFQTLYDECRVMNIKVHYSPLILIPATSVGGNGFFSAYAVEFDPSISGPSSVALVLESQHNTGPLTTYAPASTALTTPGQFPSTHKFYQLSAKTPGPLAPIVASDCPGSAWFAVDVTAPVVGVLNGYQSAMGTGGQSTFDYLLELDVEFRMRT